MRSRRQAQLVRLQFELRERQEQQARLRTLAQAPASSSRAAARGAAALGLPPTAAATSLTTLVDPIGTGSRTFIPTTPGLIFAGVPTAAQLQQVRIYAVWDLPGNPDLRGIHWSFGLTAWQGIRSLAHHYVVSEGGDPALAWDLLRWRAIRRVSTLAQAEAVFNEQSFAGNPTWWYWPADGRPRN